ncbi:hypothetical protein V5740_02410 [Croceibacterium sp. TMG7-5b_MA50]|uniref:hypothetical protein n=1 Tax=Croceibacterium sp. TMG7-5b_MA50 TaxID=3121290 RepID=UPI00322193AF
MNLALSIAVLAALALIANAAWLWRRQGGGRQGATQQVWLMLGLAAIMLANVAIVTLPAP